MTRAGSEGWDVLRHRLDDAVRGTNVAAIAQDVKHALEEVLRANGLSLPEQFRAVQSDTYARRLLHRDHAARYTIVVMTWGPGQKTALHDHAGIWCVECVVDGKMEVIQYDLIGESDGKYEFSEQTRVVASRGTAGCLIPPFEYHVLANARTDGPSITLHVYGGEMDHCHVFERSADGSYRKLTRSLSYHD
jgi:predicted metal-dependent enzyme (double-stranded beta helix superfamily)